MHAYPSGWKSQDECYHALTHFVSNKDEIGSIYSDNAPEITGAIKDLGWRHEQSKAYIHQFNALAERAIRATTEGTRSNLEQAGLSHCYWPHALEHACVCVTNRATPTVSITLRGTSVSALGFLVL